MAAASPTLVAVYEISELLGITPQHAHKLTKASTFPPPAQELHCGTIWRVRDVERWVRKHRPDLLDAAAA